MLQLIDEIFEIVDRSYTYSTLGCLGGKVENFDEIKSFNFAIFSEIYIWL